MKDKREIFIETATEGHKGENMVYEYDLTNTGHN